jgi:hypothetical protein
MTGCWLSAILIPQDVIKMEFKETVWVGFGCFSTGSSYEPSGSTSDEELLTKRSNALVLVTIYLKRQYVYKGIPSMHVWSAYGKLQRQIQFKSTCEMAGYKTSCHSYTN